MKQVIVVPTSPGREHWAKQCSESLKDTPHIVVSEYGYEIGKIRWMMENTNFDRWLMLQDSVVVKDLSLFDLAFSHPNSVALSNCPVKFGMYLGIYTRKTLSKVEIPIAHDKEDAIRYEVEWSKKYCESEKNIPTLFEDFSDGNSKRTVNIFGRENLVLENEYLIKYKGTWR